MKNLFQLILFLILNLPLFAQVPVYEEPRHKVALQNEYIRLIDVHIPPHDTTLYHRHSTPSTIVLLSKTITGSQVMGGEPNTGGTSVPGNTAYIDFGNKPLSHRVWNEDSTTFHVMDIEIFPRDNAVACDRIKEPGFKFEWEQKNVRVYKIHINAGKNSTLPRSDCPHLLIIISGLLDQLKPGDFKWYPPNADVEISNTSTGDVECVLLELK